MIEKGKGMSKKIPVKQITSWSFSRYNAYKQCPLKAKLKFIDKLQEPKTEALKRGSAVHDECEAYIKGKSNELPESAKHFGRLFRRLKKKYSQIINGMVVEDNWSFTKAWEQTRWDDWANCWVRIKLDCAELQCEGKELRIMDWKTGKYREDKNEEYIEQLELYALAALLIFEEVNLVRPVLVYLDEGKEYPTEEDLFFTRKDVNQLKEKWERRVEPMLNDTIFAPRPNNFCRFCHFRKDNAANGGGQCEY